MTDELTPPNPKEADALLSDLLQEVQKWEGTLAGGTKLGMGAEAVNSLFRTKVSLGNPKDKLIRLTDGTFKNSGTELLDIYKQQMQEQFDFYYMTISVDLRPERGAEFWRLTCELDFGPKGSKELIIQSLFPTSQWRSVMSFGVGTDVGLNGNLDWSIGVDSSQLAQLLPSIPDNLKASVATKDNFKAFLAVPAYRYELGYSARAVHRTGSYLPRIERLSGWNQSRCYTTRFWWTWQNTSVNGIARNCSRGANVVVYSQRS